jgi:hypothetical protein
MSEMPKMEKMPPPESKKRKANKEETGFSRRFSKIRERVQKKLMESEGTKDDRLLTDILKGASAMLDIIDKNKRWLNESEVAYLKDGWKKQHPESASEIENLFYLFPTWFIKREKGRSPADLCVRMTELVYRNADKSEAMKKFWERYKVIRTVFSKKEHLKKKTIDRMALAEKEGIVGQAAAVHLFNKLGFGTSMATPEEDAYESTDLWVWMPTDLIDEKEDFPIVEMGMPIQVKASCRKELTRKVEITQDDSIHYPAIQISSEKLSKDASIFISSEQFNGMPHLAETVDTKEKRIGKKVCALRVKIPYRQDFVDLDTGLPTQKCIGSAREELELLEFRI